MFRCFAKCCADGSKPSKPRPARMQDLCDEFAGPVFGCRRFRVVHFETGACA